MAVSVANYQILHTNNNKDHFLQQSSSSSGHLVSLVKCAAGFWSDQSVVSSSNFRKSRRGGGGANAFWQGAAARPTSVEMEAITSSEHLDQILMEAQNLPRPQPIIIDWMANWCRKCIYLKPKLEKLAAEYDTKLKFYYVDVNNVPQALVKRGNISKMPTIQLWKDGEMKEEVIGGHKAWLVMDEVREMIEKHLS